MANQEVTCTTPRVGGERGSAGHLLPIYCATLADCTSGRFETFRSRRSEPLSITNLQTVKCNHHSKRAGTQSASWKD